MEWKTWKIYRLARVGGPEMYVCNATKIDSFKRNTVGWGTYIRRMEKSTRCYSEVKKLTFGVLTIFGSIYSCEQAFSCMNVIKSKVSQVTNENLEKFKITSYKPNVSKLIKTMRSQRFHWIYLLKCMLLFLYFWIYK